MEKVQAAPKIQPPSHPLTSVLAVTRTIELVSNLCLLGIVAIYTYRHLKTYWPLYHRKFWYYHDRASDLLHRALDVILDDKDYPDTEDSNEPLSEEYSSDEAECSEPVEKLPEDWEWVGKRQEDTDSEYDTSSEDRVSISSIDDFEFSTPAVTRRSGSVDRCSEEENDQKCCQCKLPKKSETKQDGVFFLPESVVRMQVGRKPFPKQQ